MVIEMYKRRHSQIAKCDLLATDDAPTPGPPRLLDIDGETFRAGFNRSPFLVRHHLAGHPLFSLQRLIELANRLPEEKIKYNGADISVATGLYEGPRTGLSVRDTIQQIEECRSWMVINNVELDPEYNFLLQIRGKKQINIWNSGDRSVLSEITLERYFSDVDRQIVFKEEYQQKAAIFELTPGAGLHFPTVAPHWVRNGDEVSVSFSITFRTPASERRRVVYCANADLRGKGLNPRPPGASTFRDLAKYYGFRARSGIKRALGGHSPCGSGKLGGRRG